MKKVPDKVIPTAKKKVRPFLNFVSNNSGAYCSKCATIIPRTVIIESGAPAFRKNVKCFFIPSTSLGYGFCSNSSLKTRHILIAFFLPGCQHAYGGTGDDFRLLQVSKL